MFDTVRDSGIAFEDADVPQDWLVIGSFGTGVVDAANTHAMTVELRHLDASWDLCPTSFGDRVLVIEPGNQAAIRRMAECVRAIDLEGVVDREVYELELDDWVRTCWEEMELSERVEFCRAYGEPVHLAREHPAVPDDLRDALEQHVSEE